MSTIEELRFLQEREDHVEFKEAKHNYPFAGGKKTEPSERRRCVLGYIVALANERGGRLVLGMADVYPHSVVGSDFAEGEVGALEDEIYTRLRIRVRTEELYETVNKRKLRVLVITVPSRPVGKVLRFEGVPLMRVGESLREMDDAQFLDIIQEQDPDYSAHICKGLQIEDLDEDAINEMRNLISVNKGKNYAKTAPLQQLLSDLNLLTNDGVTYAALVLLGKSDIIHKYLPQHNVVIEYRLSHDAIRYTARQEFREPLFTGIKKIWNYINQPASNPLMQVMDLPQIINVPSFTESTIREGVINACIHRNLQMVGDILIKQYPDEIEIKSPGGFPFGVNVGNIITVNSSPRSRLMAEVIEKTGLIERSGQGVDTMYFNSISEGRTPPDYSYSDDFQVDLRISAKIEDPLFYIFIHKLQHEGIEFNVFALITLYEIKRHHIENIDKAEIPGLLQKGIIREHPYYKYVLGDGYFANMTPVKKGICAASHVSVIYYCLQEHNDAASSTEIIDSFDGTLTHRQVRYLLEKLCEIEFLTISGRAKNTRYGLNVNFLSF